MNSRLTSDKRPFESIQLYFEDQSEYNFIQGIANSDGETKLKDCKGYTPLLLKKLGQIVNKFNFE